jgi:GGDEF domain-containing protein
MRILLEGGGDGSPPRNERRSHPLNGMAAREKNPSPDPRPGGAPACLSAEALAERLDEEVSRAGRHGTHLSCLLVTVANLEELSREHGRELPGRTLAYLGRALQPHLRRFDRIGKPSEGELLLLLPGADGPRGEIVARRVLDRLRTIKVEADGARRPLQISVGLAAWRPDLSGQDLLAQARAAALRAQTDAASELPTASPPALGRPGPS